jgi:hypothetical protein
VTRRVCDKIDQTVAQLIFLAKLIFKKFPRRTIIKKYLLLLKKLAKENNRSIGENSPNLVTLLRSSSVKNPSSSQGCQIFLGIIHQKGKNIPNGHELYQSAINMYTKWPGHGPNGKNIPLCLPLQYPPKFTQIEIFGWKIYHLATPLSVKATFPEFPASIFPTKG